MLKSNDYLLQNGCHNCIHYLGNTPTSGFCNLNGKYKKFLKELEDDCDTSDLLNLFDIFMINPCGICSEWNFNKKE
jgi:hypothetical protein